MTFTTPMVLMLQLKAEIILSQGLPRHIFNILNQTNTAKEIWDNVEMLMQVHDGQIVTETVQRRAPGNVGNTGSRGNQSYGNVTTATWKKVICYNCRGEGHVARQCKEPKRAKDSQYFKDKMLLMEAKEKGVTLDAEAEAFLANVELWMRPYAGSVSWPNLSSTNGNNHHVNEVHPNAIQINDSVNYQLSHKMHHEEQSDSDVESELDDNTTPYHQLELERRAIVFQLKDIYIGHMLYLMVTILDEMRDTLDEKTQENQDLSLENQNLKAELAKFKAASRDIPKVDTIRNLQSQIIITDVECRIHSRECELKTSYEETVEISLYSRSTFTAKINALTAE
ncbi:reverse transcriptase domain-containing protein [Tanacetum coccineum]